MTVTLNTRADFTLENCRRVAWGSEAVALGETGNAKRCGRRAKLSYKLIENPDVTIYGVNTGYGGRAKLRLGCGRPQSPGAASHASPCRILG